MTCYKSVTIALLLGMMPAVAANIWDGGGTDSNWNTGANWDNNSVPAFPAAITFAGGNRLANTNNLSSITVNGITFDAAAGAFNLRGNAITLAGNIGFNGNPATVVTQTLSLPMTLSGVRNFSTQTNGVLVVNGGITAAGSYFYKNNPGTMILGGTNTFGNNNTLYCTAGVLQLGANQVMSSVAGTNNLTVGANNANGLAAVGDLAGTTQSLASLSLGSTTPGYNGLSNTLMDSVGGGVFQISGNIFCYPGGSGFSNAMATMSATWDLNGVDRNIYAGRNPANAVDLLISGPIINSGASGKGFLLYQQGGSPGVVMLTSTNNSYDGQLSVRDNKLILGANNTLPGNSALGLVSISGTSPVVDLYGTTNTVGGLTLGAGAAASVNGATPSIIDSVGGGVLKLGASGVGYNAGGTGQNGTATVSATLDLNGGNRAFNIADSTFTTNEVQVNGKIINSSGTAGLIKNGTGVMVLAGTNSYNGNTTVNGGTLQLNVASLNPAAAVYISNIGTANNPLLKLNFTGTNTVAAFYTNFVSLPDGVYTAANMPSVIAGTGALRVGTVTPTVTATWLGGSRFTYNGSGQGPTLGSLSISPPSTGATNISYLGVSGTTYGPSANPPTNTGNYQVTVTIGSDGYYPSITSSPYSFIIQNLADDSVSVYPSVPGLAASDQYAVRVCAATNGSNWQSTFAWETANGNDFTTDACFEALAGWTHTYVSFGATIPVIVEISKVDGSAITNAAVHPARMGSVTVAGGKAYVTLSNNCNVAVDINGQMDNNDTGFVVTNPNNSNIGHYWQGPPIHTISIHNNPPLTGVPATNSPSVYLVAPGVTPPSNGAWTTLYFLPGVHNVGIGFPIHKNKSYYIPGDALVYGSFCNYGNWNDGSNIRIFGHGTLSQTPWQNPKYIASATNYNWYHPIEISGASNTSVEGISIADPCYHAVMMYLAYTPSAYTVSSWVKVFGWRANGDGINPFGNGTISNCFVRTQDDSCYVNGVGMNDTVFWNDANGSAFVLTAIPDLTNRTLLVHDCDVIYSRAAWINWGGGRVFNMRGYGSGSGGSGVIFSNINVEDPHPTMQVFGCWMALASPYGSGTRGAGDWSGTVFKNVSIAATNRNYEEEILWGTNNAQIHDLTFDNLAVGGITVLTNIFKTNAYVYNLRFTNSAPRMITGLTANGGSLSFNITNNGSYVGLPGSNGASIFAVTNNGAHVVQVSSNLANANGWFSLSTNTAPFTFTDTNAASLYPQRFYRVLAQ